VTEKLDDDDAGTPSSTARRSIAVRRVEPAYRQVSNQLRELIVTGEFVPGQRLPVEAELGTLFAVSRSTVREALRELSTQNLIRTTRGIHGGSFIVEPDPAHLHEMIETSLGHLAGADALSVADILEARVLLEVPAARLAAERRTEEQNVLLRGSEVIGSSSEYRQMFYEGNVHFHEVILEASGNALLKVMTAPIFSVLSTRFHRHAAPVEFWRRVTDDHAEISSAIHDQDPDAAAAAMHLHLEHLGGVYLEIDRSARAEKNR
jgi:GntR family transcriptional repressor for pyruvate dehydrogenase complex